MDINTELDRIQKKGVSVTLRYNRSVRFIEGRKINVSTLMSADDEGDFKRTMYRAILAFDDKYPELL